MTEREFLDAVHVHQDMLFRLAYTVLHDPDDCADALQDALERAWRKLGALRDPAAFRGWMARIVINCSRDMLRRRKLRTVQLDENMPAPEVRDTGLSEALSALEEGYRLPLTLFYMENMSVAEVAQAMGLKQGTVKNRLHRGRKRLAAMLTGEEENVWN